MNNPGINLETWERLRKKWADFETSGKKVKIDFQLISSSDDEENILAIDVIQTINDEIFTETIQKITGDAYSKLGIAGLSMEQLVHFYKKMMHKLHHQSAHEDKDLVVTMSPSSATSGEIRGYLERHDSDLRSSVLVGYHHYYMLNALREKLIELTGDNCKKVKAVYRSDALELYFEY